MKWPWIGRALGKNHSLVAPKRGLGTGQGTVKESVAGRMTFVQAPAHQVVLKLYCCYPSVVAWVIMVDRSNNWFGAKGYLQ